LARTCTPSTIEGGGLGWGNLLPESIANERSHRGRAAFNWGDLVRPAGKQPDASQISIVQSRKAGGIKLNQGVQRAGRNHQTGIEKMPFI